MKRYLWTWNGEEWNAESIAHLSPEQLGALLRLRDEQGYGLTISNSDTIEPRVFATIVPAPEFTPRWGRKRGAT